MGDPKFPRRSFDAPSHPWRGERIKAETETCKLYGLKSKRELWKAQATLRKLRTQSKNLQARIRTDDPQAELESELMLNKMGRMGLLPMDGSTLDDVLGLTPEAILNRRLQTMVQRKGLATTLKQARQFIVHGHVTIDGRKVTIPGYLVKRAEEDKIVFNPHSPIANELHPLRGGSNPVAPAATSEPAPREVKNPKEEKVGKKIKNIEGEEEGSDDLPEREEE